MEALGVTVGVLFGICWILVVIEWMIKDTQSDSQMEEKKKVIKNTISGKEIAARSKDKVIRQCARCGSSRVATYCGMCGSNLIANHTLGGSKVKGVGFDTFKAEGVGFQSVS